MIFQQPTSSLNPVLDVGRQIGEVLEIHRGMNREAARKRALELLRMVGIPDPERRLEVLPARVLRRHGPARHDRDGPRLRAGAAHRRRADDGARRDDPGADPRPAARPPRAARDGDHPHHPRPRASWPRCATAWRSCTPARSSSNRRRELFRRPAPPLHRGLIGSIPVWATSATSWRHPRQRAQPHRPARGPPLRPALPRPGRGGRTLAPDHHPELLPIERARSPVLAVARRRGQAADGPPSRRGPVAMRVAAPGIARRRRGAGRPRGGQTGVPPAQRWRSPPCRPGWPVSPSAAMTAAARRWSTSSSISRSSAACSAGGSAR